MADDFHSELLLSGFVQLFFVRHTDCPMHFSITMHLQLAVHDIDDRVAARSDKLTRRFRTNLLLEIGTVELEGKGF